MKNTSSPWTAASRLGVLNALEGARDLRIMVLGDLMVDQYLLGNVHRVSPEAPVPIHRTEERDRRPGGAANVALNLRALGCQVSIAGMVGDDDHGRNLLTQLRSEAMDTRGVVSSSERPTMVTPLAPLRRRGAGAPGGTAASTAARNRHGERAAEVGVVDVQS